MLNYKRDPEGICPKIIMQIHHMAYSSRESSLNWPQTIPHLHLQFIKAQQRHSLTRKTWSILVLFWKTSCRQSE